MGVGYFRGADSRRRPHEAVGSGKLVAACGDASSWAMMSGILTGLRNVQSQMLPAGSMAPGTVIGKQTLFLISFGLFTGIDSDVLREDDTLFPRTPSRRFLTCVGNLWAKCSTESMLAAVEGKFNRVEILLRFPDTVNRHERHLNNTC